MDNDDLKQLENRIDQLIERGQRLLQENRALQSERRALHDEHARLIEKTRVARERIESMIGRLKVLEHAG